MYLPIYVKLSLLSFSYSFHTPHRPSGPPAEDRYFAGNGTKIGANISVFFITEQKKCFFLG